MLERSWISAHIPHQGGMCLLEAVLDWSETTISCRASSHRYQGNPLRVEDRLGAATGIEYGAQAIAVHGALLAAPDTRSQHGFLASVRGVTLYVARLDDLEGDLEVSAERLSGDVYVVLYQFRIAHRGKCLVEGRATVMLDVSGQSEVQG